MMYGAPATRQCHLSWLPIYPGQKPPPHAVEAAPKVCIIRCGHDKNIVPGKWPYEVADTGHIPWNGEEIQVQSFEVLCNTNLYEKQQAYRWVQSNYGQVPQGALQAGYISSTGEPLFVARAMIADEMCAGRLCASQTGAFFPWGGEEHYRQECEVLCFAD